MSNSQSPQIGTPRMEKAFSTLINAFFKSTLGRGICNACAIGNLVSEANSIKLESLDKQNGSVRTGINSAHKLMAVTYGVPEYDMPVVWSELFRTVNGKQITEIEEFYELGEVGNEPVTALLEAMGELDNAKAEFRIEMEKRRALAKSMIQRTGYTQEQLMKVEFAFETNTTIDAIDYRNHTDEEIKEDQFHGLCAVMDVLAEIDGIDSTSFKEAFEYTMPEFTPAHPELIPA